MGQGVAAPYSPPALSDSKAVEVLVYCFALMTLNTTEETLIRAQYSAGESLFACDGWDVFSSEVVPLSHGVAPEHTKAIGSMHCEFGGPWDLALNTDVFLKAWRRVIAERRYAHFGWTVKVDPDCVWLPSRFRSVVEYVDSSLVFYFNNCNEGLHGPVEVLTKGAMLRLSSGLEATCAHSDFLTAEKAQFGEDVFLRHCLQLLHVNAVNNFDLLSEANCFSRDPRRDGCISGTVAFHPFKEPHSYFECLAQARYAESLNATRNAL